MKSGTVSHEYVINMLSSFYNEENSETLDMLLMSIGI